MRSLSRGVLRRVLADQRGFSLVESVVALMIASMVFTSLAYAGMAAVRASYVGRSSQQAADLAAHRLEELRYADYGSLGHVASDLSGDPAISTCSGGKCVDPGTGTSEVLVVNSGGIARHVETEHSTATNQTSYTVRTYVTRPADSFGADYVRVTVFVSWDAYGRTHAKKVSSLITFTQRGLPLPVFKLTPLGATTAAVNPGATVVYGFTLSNQGAPDRWNLSHSGAETWVLLRDDGDGLWEPGSDTEVFADTNADGVIDTGRVDPSGAVVFWAVRAVSLAAPLVTTTTAFTATSVAQPTAVGGSQSVPTTTTVTNGVVTPSPSASPSGSPSASPSASPSDCAVSSPVPAPTAASTYSLVEYTLHNASTTGAWTGSGSSTVAGQGHPLTMDRVTPLAATLNPYSTDLSPDGGLPGRVLLTGGAFTSGTSVDNSRLVDWRATVDRKSYSGTAVLRLWAASAPSSPSASVNLRAYLYKWAKVGGTYTATQVGSPVTISVSPFGCAGFQEVAAAITVPATSLGNNAYFGVQLVNVGSNPVRLAYDVTGSYPASLVLPEK